MIKIFCFDCNFILICLEPTAKVWVFKYDFLIILNNNKKNNSAAIHIINLFNISLSFFLVCWSKLLVPYIL